MVRKRTEGTETEGRYSAWHRTLSDRLYVMDVDFVEVRIEAGASRIVGLIETASYAPDVDPLVYRKTLHAVKVEGFQGRTLRLMARRCGCSAWLVMHDYELTDFHVCSLSNFTRWWRLRKELYVRWLEALGARR
jgi:hypothetical protein